jgi:hypothetical protein
VAARRSPWRNFLARREGFLRAVSEDDTGSGHHAAQRIPDLPYQARQLSGVRPAQIRKGATQAVAC